jgi:hypothetical protein
MRRREEAGSLDLAGWPLSRYDGRVSPSRTKPNLPLGADFPTTTNATRSGDGSVRPAVMRGKRLIDLNDEILTRPGSSEVTLGYKAKPKCPGYARVTETASLWLRLQGCQQGQSKAGLVPCPKGSTADRFGVLGGTMEQVSPRAKNGFTQPGQTTNRRPPRAPARLGSGRSPHSWDQVCPSQEHRAPARCRRRPVRERRPPVNMEK